MITKEFQVLSPKQEYLLSIAREKGVLKLKDIDKVYSNEYYSDRVIDKLVQLKYLKKVMFFNKWRIRESPIGI